MNGRIYDPTIGRFLSADPLIQAPGNLQSFNRYTYVMNNPLGYTDPSGYSWVSKKWKQIRRVAVTIGSFFGGTALCGGNPQCGFIAANASYSYRKAKDHGASTHQALRNGVTSGVSAGTLIKVTGWVGSEIQIGFEKFWAASNLTAFAANVTAHALVGCAAARGFSESCRAGAAAAFGQAIIKPFVFGAIGNGVTGNWKVVAAGIAGGLAAKAADPDADPYFGAFIAAMGMYYNGMDGGCEWHAGNVCSRAGTGDIEPLTADEVVIGAAGAASFIWGWGKFVKFGRWVKRLVIGKGLPVPKGLPNTRAALHDDLVSKGFTKVGQSKNGYVTYKGPDGRVVTIKPSGEVIPTQRVWNEAGTKKFPQRQYYDGTKIPNQSHSTGHFVEPL